jgi:hypothetical protein
MANFQGRGKCTVGGAGEDEAAEASRLAAGGGVAHMFTHQSLMGGGEKVPPPIDASCTRDSVFAPLLAEAVLFICILGGETQERKARWRGKRRWNSSTR